ncbi:hypothetical protein [Croceicoccus mobilis]|uniref:Uncharacterized protein n=1 Tax=Croceicoccus mobilis TaxID=1703339 RepID=A0A916Z3S0_9SPHN|nr:hypothetical protein [Croceicoccus mobilis]GGD72305.1 hypothetical protein GCM10010990_22260 [Croceicoccus mobilis]
MPGKTPDICETLSAALSDTIIHLVETRVSEPFLQRRARNECTSLFLTVASYAEREERVDIAKMMHQYASRSKEPG